MDRPTWKHEHDAAAVPLELSKAWLRAQKIPALYKWTEMQAPFTYIYDDEKMLRVHTKYIYIFDLSNTPKNEHSSTSTIAFEHDHEVQ